MTKARYRVVARMETGDRRKVDERGGFANCPPQRSVLAWAGKFGCFQWLNASDIDTAPVIAEAAKYDILFLFCRICSLCLVGDGHGGVPAATVICVSVS